jgi:hypothetical protein
VALLMYPFLIIINSFSNIAYLVDSIPFCYSKVDYLSLWKAMELRIRMRHRLQQAEIDEVASILTVDR